MPRKPNPEREAVKAKLRKRGIKFRNNASTVSLQKLLDEAGDVVEAVADLADGASIPEVVKVVKEVVDVAKVFIPSWHRNAKRLPPGKSKAKLVRKKKPNAGGWVEVAVDDLPEWLR